MRTDHVSSPDWEDTPWPHSILACAHGEPDRPEMLARVFRKARCTVKAHPAARVVLMIDAGNRKHIESIGGRILFTTPSYTMPWGHPAGWHEIPAEKKHLEHAATPLYTWHRDRNGLPAAARRDAPASLQRHSRIGCISTILVVAFGEHPEIPIHRIQELAYLLAGTSTRPFPTLRWPVWYGGRGGRSLQLHQQPPGQTSRILHP